MKQVIVKFNEEQINSFLVDIAEKLSDYEYVKYLKGQRDLTPSDSLDIVVLLKFKDIYEIEHFYSALNKRMSDSKEIQTFFRGADNQSFLFPGGVNIHFTDKEKFIKIMGDKLWNIHSILVQDDYVPIANSFIDKNADGFFVVLERDVFRDKDVEFDRFWRN